MRIIRTCLAVLLVLGSLAIPGLAQAQAPLEKRIALVIGNSAYQTGALPTPANDAGLIAQTLQAAGFDVVGARDLDQDSLRHTFRDFLDKATASGPDTVVFVYLAGYGLQYEGENYFAGVDAKMTRATDVPVEAIRVSDFTKSLAALQNKGTIMVLDAARTNPFVRSDQPLAGGLAIVDPDPNVLIGFNAAPGTVAPPEPGPYGAYAHALAEMIRVGGLGLDDVFDRTRLRVSDATKGGELPWNASKFRTPFLFFDKGPDAPAQQVSALQGGAMRAKAIRDFDARDAYLAALDRDTLRGYEDFLAAYPSDPMARRVRAIVAARREAITWRQTWVADTPEAYWSYLRRYPHGPHGWDARRRLDHFEAALEPPASFTVIAYDVPPPPETEIIYVDRPVLYFDDPEFDFAPPPPPPVIFLPPPPPDFIVLAPPPAPVDLYVLPVPAFVPVAEWVRPARDIAPPENNVIFNNIHNTVINNTTTIVQEPAAAPSPGLSTGAKVAGAAVAVGAAAAALHVALPPSVQKKAAVMPNQNPVAPAKPAAPGPVPAAIKPQDSHSLPGTNGSRLPLINGKPALQNPAPVQTPALQAVTKTPGKANAAMVKPPLPGHALSAAPSSAAPLAPGKAAVSTGRNKAGKNALPAAVNRQPTIAAQARHKAAPNPQPRTIPPAVAKLNASPRPHNQAAPRPPVQRAQPQNQARVNAQVSRPSSPVPQAHTPVQVQPRRQVEARPPAGRPQPHVPQKPGMKKECGGQDQPACPK